VNSYTIYKRGKEQREHSNNFIYNRGSFQKCTYRHFIFGGNLLCWGHKRFWKCL